jgi:diguanylate cyclase (GGDEF)-like protein
MAANVRSIRLLTTDEALLAAVRAAVGGLEGCELVPSTTAEELLAAGARAGDVVLVDRSFAPENVYELVRRLGAAHVGRTFVVVPQGNKLAEPIARFCGAAGVLLRPFGTAELRRILGERAALPAAPERARKAGAAGRSPLEETRKLPAALLRDAAGRPDQRLIDHLTDPETQLFHYSFLHFKLDEEFKRAQRFAHPLSCVMLGFEGQASEQVLRELSGIFLSASRDTDVLGRFDENSFLFLLPLTGSDGAEIMAKRVGEQARELELRDLVGDPLAIAVGISTYPHPEIRQREDLFHRARQAFLAARAAGGGVINAL